MAGVAGAVEKGRALGRGRIVRYDKICVKKSGRLVKSVTIRGGLYDTSQ